jgi:hypothetical protein
VRNEIKAKRVIVNARGRISDRGGLNVNVLFDLIETQDFIDGAPSLKFSYGNFRYEGHLATQVVSRVFYGALLNLGGGGIQTSISLNSADSFTVMSAISETGI